MKLLVGWYNPDTTQLVDIPGFDADHVLDPGYWGWLPAVLETDAILGFDGLP